MEAAARRVLAGYGYQEIRLPVMESTGLFARSIGEVTDIVEKEMYTFEDRNGDSISLRPEGTAGCVRAVVQHNLAITPRRLWYMGPMFRYERPQKGRQRQFHQLGVEAFGVASPDQDAEILLLCQRLWQALGVADDLKLELNSIGNTASRDRFRSELVKYLQQYRGDIDEDSQRRLETNPLRILDSKHSRTQEIVDSGPRLLDFLDDESRADFERLQDLLSTSGVAFELNPKLVRGLDYYNKTVFEWTTTALGAQGTVCGGGRYDGLVRQFGGKDVPAAGFGLGLERLILLMQAQGEQKEPAAEIYVVTSDESAYRHALPRVEALRSAFPRLRIVQHLGGGSFKSQFKRADKSGAALALVFGDTECSNNTVTLKPLRGGDQRSIDDAGLSDAVAEQFEIESEEVF
ncbi:histidyl-tRNA synthetase [Luminiphilus syltensis NOR5-1B]|uniref:Histidine--tRNA ligase n=1 Tax=Luminiphilus syltensis NOR5-1B TaxID=565045 RepID=B8KXH5_9GAMM|nr:histidyl-tRNA synthetase [Luminiphilus syltensis NOR5-1B]